MRRHAAFDIGLLASGVLASALLLAPSAHADIWKWVDAHGQPHYSDRWTPGAVLIKSEHVRADEASGPAASQTLEATDRQITDELNREEARRAVDKDEAAARAKQCKAAKDHYQQVIQSRRIYREDKSGERHYLSDEEADKERVQARLDMQSACGPNAS